MERNIRTIERHLARRRFLGGLAAAGSGVVLAALAGGYGGVADALTVTGQPAPDTGSGPFTLPPLPYDVAALEPHIDAQTMTIHHGRHHAAYVKNLNAAVEALPDLQALDLEGLVKSLDLIPEEKRTAVRNNAGGHLNHTLFWEGMAPNGGGEPRGALAAAIAETFGDPAALHEAVNAAALARFGSGWAWLVLADDGALAITSTPNQDNPLMDGLVEVPGTPLLGVDVWEHAYYLQYQNKRADYLNAWWHTVNWDVVGRRYERARG